MCHCSHALVKARRDLPASEKAPVHVEARCTAHLLVISSSLIAIPSSRFAIIGIVIAIAENRKPGWMGWVGVGWDGTGWDGVRWGGVRLFRKPTLVAKVVWHPRVGEGWAEDDGGGLTFDGASLVLEPDEDAHRLVLGKVWLLHLRWM